MIEWLFLAKTANSVFHQQNFWNATLSYLSFWSWINHSINAIYTSLKDIIFYYKIHLYTKRYWRVSWYIDHVDTEGCQRRSRTRRNRSRNSIVNFAFFAGCDLKLIKDYLHMLTCCSDTARVMRFVPKWEVPGLQNFTQGISPRRDARYCGNLRFYRKRPHFIRTSVVRIRNGTSATVSLGNTAPSQWLCTIYLVSSR